MRRCFASRRLGAHAAIAASACLAAQKRFHSEADERVQVTPRKSRVRRRDGRHAPEAHSEYPSFTPNSDLDHWKSENARFYGEGSYPLYRALYKDLCDEMRREVHAKPPPPFDNFSVKHEVGSDYVIFERPADAKRGRIFAHGELKLADPKQKNELMTFLHFYPIDVLIAKGDLVLHVSCCNVESNYHIRNIRIFEDPEGKLASSYDLDANYIRKLLLYDGPYMGHLELDFSRELWDVVFDHGINPDTVKFFAEWVAYLEHVEYTNWNLKLQKVLLPGGVEGEEDVLTREERQELDLATEEWLPVRDM